MKRLVFCFDGTSNTLATETPTNVAITASSIRNSAPDGPQIVYYDEGVGSTKQDKLVGGAFGHGLYDNVMDAYKFLVFNYEPHDEIFIFGFSRGAYTARSFAGLIHNLGVVSSCFADKIAVATSLYRQRRNAPPTFFDDLKAFRQQFVPDCCANPEDAAWRKANDPLFDDAKAPIVQIKYIGVWDTVKTLGSALLGDQDGDGEADDEEFHDHNLYPSVDSARHAVALDERRGKFDVTLWDNVDELNIAKGFKADDPERPYQQVWFPGTHGSVGGGGDVRGLSDEALEWIWEGAKKAHLRFDSTSISRIYGIRPDVLAKNDNTEKFNWNPKSIVMRFLPPIIHRQGPRSMHEVSRSALVRWAAPEGATPDRDLYRPKPLDDLKGQLDEAAREFEPWMYATRGAYVADGVQLPATVSAAGHEFRRHRIGPNQSLADISEHYFQSKGRVADILAANRTTILDPDRYNAGQIINIPMA